MYSFLFLIWIKNIIWMIHDLLNTVFIRKNIKNNYWNEMIFKDLYNDKQIYRKIWILNKFLRYNYK